MNTTKFAPPPEYANWRCTGCQGAVVRWIPGPTSKYHGSELLICSQNYQQQAQACKNFRHVLKQGPTPQAVPQAFPQAAAQNYEQAFNSRANPTPSFLQRQEPMQPQMYQAAAQPVHQQVPQQNQAPAFQGGIDNSRLAALEFKMETILAFVQEIKQHLTNYNEEEAHD